ncbi:MAG: NfeD family protein [Phycisphaerales bacterium]
MHSVQSRLPIRFIMAAITLLAAMVATALSPASRADAPANATAPSAPAAPSLSAAPASISAARQANSVAVITIDGPIDQITARSFRRRLDEAVAMKADAVVIDLNTPGGQLGAVLEISNALKQSPIRNTVAWIHPQAYSGGAIIALACREIIVSDGSGFGDAKVITINPLSFTTQIRGMSETERQKLLPPLLADLVDSARRHNRAAGAYEWDELLVQAIVATDAELWWVRDNKTGVRFAVDRAEFERLFPDRPVLQPMLATASVGSNEAGKRANAKPIPKPTESSSGEQSPPPSPDAAPTETPFTPAAPSLGDIKQKTEEALDLAGAGPSMRPRSAGNNDGRYTLLGKISNGDGAIVLHENEMVFFQLAANTKPGYDGAPALNAINNDASLVSFFGASSITRLDENWSEELARFLSASWVRGLLITIFLICLFIEMFSPGVTIPGVIAAVCLILLFLPPLIVGMAMWWQLAAIGVGVLCLAAEIFVLPGFGVAGVIGFVALFIGLVGVFIPGSSGTGATAAQFRSGLATGISTMLLAGATTFITLFFIYRNAANIPAIRRLILQSPDMDDNEFGGETMLAAMGTDPVQVGEIGRATTPLRPSGKVEIRGTLHDVVAEFGFVESGAQVRVVSVSPFRIGVDAVRQV